ncbi:MAG: hypothetical protein R6V76_00550 [Desulfobacterales bacterium]
MKEKAREAREPGMSLSEILRRLELSLTDVSQTVKRGEYDADFQGSLGIIDSSGITFKSPENYRFTPYIKSLHKLDIQAD